MKILLILLAQNSIEQTAEDQSIRSLISVLSVF
ncbi:hypothetical protein DFQ02_102219 [Seonamhaeicola aphaedonensis]|uniref:Uncharacterized protein n=1 Tax=Seonamhaeicola aphaedonensis TaxID=1461338 RepID=A0A3D9HIX4_9FLAO|nr:hypothetical protein DFQ02_102219 [Seonamhaeicola aphaedonensis]